MPQHVSILQLTGVAFLALVSVAWLVGLIRMLRRARAEVTVWHTGSAALYAVPDQRQTGPHREAVELTPAERDTFAVLIRQLNDRG
ncbi:hypothetical protein [Streptomyces griseus]|uniref:hypothetical protein n=1 Tax=Streptomyces griseus TaxID=1911 RepID=UPI000569AC9F|nr:hypothetical protein [Streptomyces griseus]